MIDLDTAMALSAAKLGAQHKLATADAIIYANARAHGAVVLTCGRHLQNLPGVHYIAKPAASDSHSRLHCSSHQTALITVL